MSGFSASGSLAFVVVEKLYRFFEEPFKEMVL